MAMIRWDPNMDMLNMRNQFERMVRDVDRMFGGVLPQRQTLIPTVEVYETENEIVIQCELPGLEQKDVDVVTTRDTVTISGELKRREGLKEEDCLLCERMYEKFSRTLNLPDPIDFDRTKASFKNGLLTITAPLAEGAKRRPHRIEIET